MRHRKKTVKLGRTSSHRDAMMASLVCNLIAEKRIQTTLPKAKAARSLADKMVTLGKKGTLASRRLAISRLHQPDRVKELFENVAPAFADRAGGYTRIVKLGRRSSDSSEMAILEWVDYIPAGQKKKATKAAAKPVADKKEVKKPKAKKSDTKKSEESDDK